MGERKLNLLPSGHLARKFNAQSRSPPAARPPSMAFAPLLSSPGRNLRSQKRAKDRAKRHPAYGQSVSGKQTSGFLSSWNSPLSP